MKLKEKLAEEYGEEEKRFTHKEYQAFLDGFEIARDLCARRCRSSVDISKIDNPSESIINCNLQAIHDARICRGLGEEEV